MAKNRSIALEDMRKEVAVEFEKHYDKNEEFQEKLEGKMENLRYIYDTNMKTILKTVSE